MAKRHPASLKEAIKALYLQGVGPQAIFERFPTKGVSAALISTWAKRYGWTVLRGELKAQGALVQVTPQDDPQAAQEARIRGRLVDELENQVATLAREPFAGYGELPGRDGRAATVRAIVDTASTLYG